MKKLFFCFIAGTISIASFAHRGASHVQQKKIAPVSPMQTAQQNLNGAAHKTTGDGDTLLLQNVLPTDTITSYTVGASADSGFITGPNIYNDKGFAERYDFNGADSSLQVIGVLSMFHGQYNPASTRNVNFKVWDVSAQVGTADPNIFFSGFPNNVLTQQAVPVTALGIDNTGVQDSTKIFGFSTPTGFLTSSFYVGYDVAYDFSTINGDLFGLITTTDGSRTAPIYTVNANNDTIINVQNATQYNDPSDTLWHDNAVDNYFIQNDLYIFPVVVVKWSATGIKSLTNKNLSFFGNYPNPATNSTNIQYSLSQPADVTVQIMDINGRVLNTYTEAKAGTGQHILPIATDALASGTYIYVIRTSLGDGIASQLSIIK